MPFSRSRRSGPLSRRTPAIDSQHLAKYAPLLEETNPVYNAVAKAFLKPAGLAPPPGGQGYSDCHLYFIILC